MRRTTSTLAVTAMVGGLLALGMPNASAADIPLATNDITGLRAAVTAANATPDHDTITLTPGTTYTLDGAASEDANASGDLDVTAPLTIIGTGAVLDAAGVDRFFDLRGGSLTLIDVDIVNGASPGAENGGAIRTAAGTTLTLTEGSISDSTAINPGAPVASAGSGGAVATAGSISVTDTTFDENSVSRAGGAIEVAAGGSVAITGGMFTGNDAGAAPGNGGAVHITGNGTLTILVGTYSGNTAVEGGALWNSSTGVMTVAFAEIRNNIASGADADQGGGGIFNEGGLLDVDGGHISGNAATGTAGSGGGIQNINGTLDVNGTELRGNTAMRAGGGIESGPLLPVGDPAPPAKPTSTTLFGVFLVDNHLLGTPRNGGGLHLTGAGTVDITASWVFDNTAAEGGGLWISAAGVMTITYCLIMRNVADGPAADQGGGGVFSEGGSVTIDDGAVSENRATGELGSGGGILNLNGTLKVFNAAEIRGNSAQRAGGGIEAGPLIGATTVPTTTMLDGVRLQDNMLLGSPRNGGGLHLTGAGTVDVVNSSVLGNTAAEGGGLWNSAAGIMTITDSLIAENTADGPAADQGGGGIFSEGGAVTVTGGAIGSNAATGLLGSGGGILNLNGTLSVANIEISANTAQRAGGGIEAGPLLGAAAVPTLTTLSRVNLQNNHVLGSPGNGGGLHLTGAGTVDVVDSGVSDGTAAQGGGLWNSARGTMTVTNSALVGNTASDSGGGLYNDGGTLTATNVTITANTAATGGGVNGEEGSTTTLLHATVVGNSSGIAGPTTLTNSIVAANSGANVEASSALGSGGGNVLGLGVTSTNPADAVGVGSPGLGVLANSGGFSPTMLPLAGSPAIDFGLNAESTPTDQRGVARPVDGDGNGTLRVDAGAVEAPAVAMAPPPAGPGPLQPSPPAQPVRAQPTYTG